MTNEQKRLLKAMRSTHIRASIYLCFMAVSCAALAVLIIGKSWSMVLLLALIAAFIVYVAVYSICQYKKSADIIKNTVAEKCVVEMLFVVERYGGGYEYSPVVRTPGGKLVMTFGKYDKSMYVKIPVKKREDRGRLQIQRSDRSVVKVGDTVLAYIKGYHDCKIAPNNKNDADYDLKASAIKDVKVFEGVIDVE